MSINNCMIRKLIAGCLTILLTGPLAGAAAAPLQQMVPSESSQTSAPVQEKTQGTNPESIGQGSNIVLPENPLPNASNLSADPAQSANQSVQSAASQPAPEQQQNDAQQPVGTAAAPHEESTGVAASRPAGAVIAPAKQRRARSFIIKLGVVIGVCVAVGTVAALSHGSPSQAH